MTCTECPHAIWDYEEYYGTTQKQWFVDGCKIGKDPEECEDEAEQTYYTGVIQPT